MNGRAYGVLALLSVGLVAVFVGVLRHLVPMAWDSRANGAPVSVRTTIVERMLIVIPLVILLTLGLWMPGPLKELLGAASDIVRGVPPLQQPVWGSSAL